MLCARSPLQEWPLHFTRLQIWPQGLNNIINGTRRQCQLTQSTGELTFPSFGDQLWAIGTSNGHGTVSYRMNVMVEGYGQVAA